MPKQICPLEDYEQARFATWLTRQGIRFYAIPNGGRRGLMDGVMLKRTGVQPGVPDICIPIPSGHYHGLYIELKRQFGGALSDSQKVWLQYLRSKDYMAEMANGFEEAKNIVIKYLALTPKSS